MSEVVNESCVEEWQSAKPKVRCPVAFAFTDYFGQLATSASSLVVSVDETSENAIARGELAPSARSVPLVQPVAGPLLLSHLATARPLSEDQVADLATTIAAGVKALHGADRSPR